MKYQMPAASSTETTPARLLRQVHTVLRWAWNTPMYRAVLVAHTRKTAKMIWSRSKCPACIFPLYNKPLYWQMVMKAMMIRARIMPT